MKYVRQKHRYGCGPACLAMITDMEYDKVIKILGGDFDTNYGMTHHDFDDFLVERGFAISRKFKYLRGNATRSPWPPAPWADIHIVQAQMVGGTHFLIWQCMFYGSEIWPVILDPNRPYSPKLDSLSDPCYLEINQIAGIHKI